MINYIEDLRMFEYRTDKSNLFCNSLSGLITQAKTIYNIDLLTILN